MRNLLLTVVNTLLVLWWTPSSYWIIILSIPVTKTCHDSCPSCENEKTMSMLSPLSLKLGRSGIIVISDAEIGQLFEPGTSRTLSENYTPKPISLVSTGGIISFFRSKKKVSLSPLQLFREELHWGGFILYLPTFFRASTSSILWPASGDFQRAVSFRQQTISTWKRKVNMIPTFISFNKYTVINVPYEQ